MGVNRMKVKKHNSAGCFLLRKYKSIWEIILIYKKWAEDNQGWVPPKGHIEKGETDEEAAIRETIEETGYKNMKVIKSLKTLNIDYPWDDGFLHKKSIHYFLAELIDEEKVDLKLSEWERNSTKEIRWVSLEEAENNLKFVYEREILKEVKTFVQ